MAHYSLTSIGNLYIADCYNNRVRKVTISSGIITSIVGTGTQSYSGDNGPATSAALYLPSGIAFDPSGNIYISDRFNHRIRKVTVSTGIITTICGTGSGGYNSDGIRATSAAIYSPFGISLDYSGIISIIIFINMGIYYSHLYQVICTLRTAVIIVFVK